MRTCSIHGCEEFYGLLALGIVGLFVLAAVGFVLVVRFGGNWGTKKEVYPLPDGGTEVHRTHRKTGECTVYIYDRDGTLITSREVK